MQNVSQTRDNSLFDLLSCIPVYRVMDREVAVADLLCWVDEAIAAVRACVNSDRTEVECSLNDA